MFSFFAQLRAKNKKNAFYIKSEQALKNNQVLMATVILNEANNSQRRVDASLTKVGRVYKLMLTEKKGGGSIRFDQKDFDSLERIDVYLAKNTQLMLTDFKFKTIEPTDTLFEERP